jgi:hypothetical protein
VWPVAKAGGSLTVDDFVECLAEVRRLRDTDGPFDACFVDRSPTVGDSETTDKIGRLTGGGMTWWIDSLDDPTVPFERHRDRVLAGPPS